MKLPRQVAVWLLSQVAAPLLVEEAASRAGGSPVVVEGAEAVGIQVMEAAEAITGGLSEVSCGFTVKDRRDQRVGPWVLHQWKNAGGGVNSQTAGVYSQCRGRLQSGC